MRIKITFGEIFSESFGLIQQQPENLICLQALQHTVILYIRKILIHGDLNTKNL